MRRLARHAFTALSALSLLLCMAVFVLWVRSYSISDAAGRVGQAKVICINSLAGSLHLGVTLADPENEEPGPRPYYFYNRSPSSGSLGVMSGGKAVRFGGRMNINPGYGWIVAPHWLLVLATLPGAAWSVRRMWRSILAKIRRNYGHCPACGYDVRATPDRCPECGAAAPR
jgi:hypothetical protein